MRGEAVVSVGEIELLCKVFLACFEEILYTLTRTSIKTSRQAMLNS